MDGNDPLSVMSETNVKKNVRDDPLSITSTGVAFILASEKNLKDLVHENKEKYERIKTLEE
jgi:hypothetical protein